MPRAARNHYAQRVGMDQGPASLGPTGTAVTIKTKENAENVHHHLQWPPDFLSTFY